MGSAATQPAIRVPGEDQLLIGGHWVAPATDRKVDVRAAATGEIVARVPDPSREDADRAVAAARKAFDEGPWPRMTMAERIANVRRFTDAIEARMDDLDVAWTTECGATVALRQVLNHAFGPGSWNQALRLAAELAVTEIRPGGDMGNGDMGDIEVRREPIGVVLNIITYNGPVCHMGLKVAPALLAGCPVIVKPAPDTQLVGGLLAEAAEAAEFPEGVISFLAAGADVAGYLVGHDGVDMVNFTGGTSIGKQIMATCAARIAKCTLELGGKSAAIIADDIPLAEAIPAVLSGMLPFQGQICTALTRILVSNSRHDEVVAALAEAMQAQKIGDPHDPDTDWGPLAVERARDRAQAATDAAVQAGATLVTGGKTPEGFENGWYFEPTLLTNVDNSMAIAQEEVFGPVYSVIRYDDIDDAIRIANDSRFGLFGAVFTNDRETALRVAHGVRAGTFAINGGGCCLTTPFGGMKQSGIGREAGPEGILEYTELKAVVLSPLAS